MGFAHSHQGSALDPAKVHLFQGRRAIEREVAPRSGGWWLVEFSIRGKVSFDEVGRLYERPRFEKAGLEAIRARLRLRANAQDLEAARKVVLRA